MNSIIVLDSGALKMTDKKVTDQISRHENAGHKIARHDIYLYCCFYQSQYLSSIVETLM